MGPLASSIGYIVHSAQPLTRKTPDGYLLGSYRIATAPEPNSSRLTSFKSTCFDSPANNVGPWPASLGCTTNSTRSRVRDTTYFLAASIVRARGGHRPGRGSRPRDDASLRPRPLHGDRSTRPM